MDESKPKSDDLAAMDYNSDRNRYFVDEAMPTTTMTTSFECSILSEFGWTANTIQQQQKHIHQRRHSIGDDPFMNNDEESMQISERSSSDVGRDLLSPSSSVNNMRLQVGFEQAATSSNHPSVSSSSSDQDLVEKSIGSDEQNPPPSVKIPSKTKGQKRIRQQRFAFVTKSEVDHLEDGYRWRKYGQKAVKNSPYPRSYYRCTNTKCTVKKRVERSCEDPTKVITTYEGQHCHQTAGFSRSGGGLSIREAAFGVQMSPSNSQFYYQGVQHFHQQSPQGSIASTPQEPSIPAGDQSSVNNRMIAHTEPPLPLAGGTPDQFSSDEGLLGDIVSPRLRNNFNP